MADATINIAKVLICFQQARGKTSTHLKLHTRGQKALADCVCSSLKQRWLFSCEFPLLLTLPTHSLGSQTAVNHRPSRYHQLGGPGTTLFEVNPEPCITRQGCLSTSDFSLLLCFHRTKLPAEADAAILCHLPFKPGILLED